MPRQNANCIFSLDPWSGSDTAVVNALVFRLYKGGAAGYRMRTANYTGVGMFDLDRHGNHAGAAVHIAVALPDRVRHRGHAGRARRALSACPSLHYRPRLRVAPVTTQGKGQ